MTIPPETSSDDLRDLFHTVKVGFSTEPTKGDEMDTRRTGRIFGWFFIGTFVTSIPARLLFVDGLGAELERHALHPRGRSPTRA